MLCGLVCGILFSFGCVVSFLKLPSFKCSIALFSVFCGLVPLYCGVLSSVCGSVAHFLWFIFSHPMALVPRVLWSSFIRPMALFPRVLWSSSYMFWELPTKRDKQRVQPLPTASFSSRGDSRELPRVYEGGWLLSRQKPFLFFITYSISLHRSGFVCRSDEKRYRQLLRPHFFPKSNLLKTLSYHHILSVLLEVKMCFGQKNICDYPENISGHWLMSCEWEHVSEKHTDVRRGQNFLTGNTISIIHVNLYSQWK